MNAGRHLMIKVAWCRLRRRSRALERRGFAASSYKADARHYDLLYIYNPQQVAMVLAILSPVVAILSPG